MTLGGTPVPRDLVFVLKSGETVIDWGDGMVQDIMTGEFMPLEETDYGSPIGDSDLEMLKKNGQVESYDGNVVYVQSLPQRPWRTLD